MHQQNQVDLPSFIDKIIGTQNNDLIKIKLDISDYTNN